MRKLFGMGTPRGLQPEGDAASLAYLLMLTLCRALRTSLRLATAHECGAVNQPPPPAGPAT